jgi:hypothetical protein
MQRMTPPIRSRWRPPAVREPTIAVAEAGDEESGVLDPFYEELWEGTGAMQLDIPALDLDWGDIDDEGDDPPPYA